MDTTPEHTHVHIQAHTQCSTATHIRTHECTNTVTFIEHSCMNKSKHEHTNMHMLLYMNAHTIARISTQAEYV